jgi:SAM-dependent methyltransferase
VWYSGARSLVAHMAREERQRSLTVVGGARGEVARYASLLPESGGPVLVLGVADGLLAEALVLRGVPVTGVDPSPRMLARAEETRAGLPPEMQGRLHLLHADLRSLRLAERFVGVFAPRDAVALVATRGDLEALFVTAREHLGPGASFAFDLSLPPPRWLSPDDVDPHEGVQPERAVFTPHLHSRRTRQGHRDIHRLLLRHFTAGEVDHALAAAELEPLSRDRDFEGRPWEPGSDRMFVVAQARPGPSRS